MLEDDESFQEVLDALTSGDTTVGNDPTSAKLENAASGVEQHIEINNDNNNSSSNSNNSNNKKKRTFVDASLPSLTSMMPMRTNMGSTETTPSRNAKRRRRTNAPTMECSQPTACGPDVDIVRRFQESLARSTASQKALEEWDRQNGLPRSHCQTMVNSLRSRKQLQSGLVLPKWNGQPLIPGGTAIGLHSSRRLLSE